MDSWDENAVHPAEPIEPPVIVLDEQGRPQPILHIRSGIPVVSYAILAIIAVVFLVEFFTGAVSDIDQLIAMGAKYNARIAAGEYWRLLSCVFLHADFQHIFFNGYALFIWGPMVERLFGRVKMLGIYLAAGLMGSIASYAFSNAISVGASGAIFGLLGALLTLRARDRELFRRLFGMQLFIILAMNIFYGLVAGNIDNFGHFGGLVGGFLAACALGLYRERGITGKGIVAILLIFALAGGGLYMGDAHAAPQVAAESALLALEAGDLPEAVKQADQAVSLNGEDERIRTIAAHVYVQDAIQRYETEDFEGVAAASQKAIAVYKDDPFSYVLLADAKLQLGDWEGAMKAAGAGREAVGNTAEFETVDALVYYYQGDMQAAIGALNRALEIAPDYAFAKQLLAEFENTR